MTSQVHAERDVAAESSPNRTLTVRLRYFAAAAEAAGRGAEEMTVPASTTVADLASRLTAEHGDELGRVLAIASLLIDDETRVVADDGAAPLVSPALPAENVRVDVLPPFAGG